MILEDRPHVFEFFQQWPDSRVNEILCMAERLHEMAQYDFFYIAN